MWSIMNNNGILETPDYPPYEPKSKGIGDFVFSALKKYEDRVAQIELKTNKIITYRELLRDSIRCALEIKSLGITENDVISLCTHTHSQACIPYFATMFLGAKPANLEPILHKNDIAHLTNLVKPKLIFCEEESVELLEQVMTETNQKFILVVFGETDKHLSFSNFLRPKAEENDFKPKIADDMFDTATIQFSSGTTGVHKAVCITHYGAVYTTNISSDYFDLTTSLFYFNPFWVSYFIFTTSVLAVGGKIILAGNFDDHKFVKTIQDYEVTTAFIPVAYTYPIVHNSENYGFETSSLKTLLTAGSTISKNQMKKIQKVFPSSTISQVYGLTEVAAFLTTFHSKYHGDTVKNKLGSTGLMCAGTKFKIVDIETNQLVTEAYKKGELLVKNKRLLKEYLNNEKATKEVFDEDGFLHTGDIVYYDEDYCFYVVGRMKEMFKYKYWHIVPSQLEEILLTHPSVKECLVIGYPDEVDGYRPMAVIITKEETSVTESDIMEFFNAQVSDQKKLRGGVKFVQNLPKTATGKYSRRMLQTMVVNNEI